MLPAGVVPPDAPLDLRRLILLNAAARPTADKAILDRAHVCANEALTLIDFATFLAIVSLVALTAVAWGYAAYRRDIDARRERLRGVSRIAETACGPIEYAEAGAGIPLLSIHGAGGGFDQGLANAARLVGDGFRIVAPSRFGYLGTPVPPDTSLDAYSAAQADAHAGLLSELNVPKSAVVGVSAGARSAVELALRHPERVAALILVVPGLYSPTSPVSIEANRGNAFVFRVVNAGGDFAWWIVEKIAPSVLIRFLGVRPSVVALASRVERDRVMSIVRSVEPLSLRFAGINVDSVPPSRNSPIKNIAAPTLIISARDDLFNTLPAAEFAANKIPGAKLVVYDAGGHLLVGHEADVRAAVLTFLARQGVIAPSAIGDGRVDMQKLPK